MDYDLVVIGGGSAGVRSARFAAALGARVAVVEAGRLGGTCVNVGCVPKKLFSYGAHFAEDLEDMRSYGWTAEGVRFDWATLVAAKDREILRLNGVYGKLLTNAGVTVVEGWARVAGPNEVDVGGKRLTAGKILVATGGRPWRPPNLPGAHLGWTSDDLFALPALPRSIAIVGSGYIACEFASILHGLGVKVTLVMRNELPMRGFDPDLRAALARAFEHQGMHIAATVSPESIDRVEGGLVTTLSDGVRLETDAVLLATGRVPNTAEAGLTEVGVALDPEGAVIVDGDFRTSVPSIFAVGDVVARLELTPVALAEGMMFAHAQFGGAPKPVSYDDVPTAVFTNPQLGTVGLTEPDARQRYGDIDVYVSSFRSLKHSLTPREVRSVVKVIVEPVSQRVVGIHLLDEDAAEITQGFAAAMKAGITKPQLDATIGIHPTVAEELVTMRTKRAG